MTGPHAASPAADGAAPTVPARSGTEIDRAFVRLTEGLVHYRHADPVGDAAAAIPLYVVHASPGSARVLEGLIRLLGRDRRVIAPDTLGNGDSAAPCLAGPELDYFADSVVRVLDALGLDQVDLYGTHTGAHIAVEVAIRRPDRVRRLVLDGLALFSTEIQAEMLADYAPKIVPDATGSHVMWAWHYVRDVSQWFPYNRRDAEHRLQYSLPPPAILHDTMVDLMKALTTYELSYNAVFRHAWRERLPLAEVPTLCLSTELDPLSTYLDLGVELLPQAKGLLLPPPFETLTERRAKAITEFLD